VQTAEQDLILLKKTFKKWTESTKLILRSKRALKNETEQIEPQPPFVTKQTTLEKRKRKSSGCRQLGRQRAALAF